MNLDFSDVKILVIGDPMVDEYHFGHVDRISPEAPVPIFLQDSAESRAGGAANVYCQLNMLGCKTKAAFPMRANNWFGWTQKNRYMVGNHQLFRHDHDRCVENSLSNSHPLNQFDAIVISDYAKGACTPNICQKAISTGVPVIVDPKGKDWSKYQGCTVICPNHLEVNGNEGFDVIEKRGPLGLRYKGIDYPSTAKRVYDVTGAGDVVVSIIAACVAKGIDIPTACRLANLAAGYAVEQVGTTVCPIEKLRDLCKDLA